MKNIFLLLFLVSFAGSCQDKESRLYPPTVPSDTIYVPSDPIYLPSDTIFTPSDPIIIRDTVEVAEKVITTFKDRLVELRFLATGQDTLDNWVAYGVNKGGSALKIKMKDTLGLSAKYIQGGDRIKMNIRFTEHTYGDSTYAVGAELIRMPFRVLKHAIREMDSAKAVTQTYMNKNWDFSFKEADNVVELGAMAFSEWCCSAGNPHPNSWRHSRVFTKKYWQIRARDKETGEIVILPVYGNIYITP